MDLAPVEESVVRAALGMNEQKAPAWVEPEFEVGAGQGRRWPAAGASLPPALRQPQLGVGCGSQALQHQRWSPKATLFPRVLLKECLGILVAARSRL